MRSTVDPAPRLLSAALAVILLSSCTAYRPLKVDALPGGLREGDRVSITLKNGKATSLTVVGLTADAIRGGGGEAIRFSDIETIQVARPDTKETFRRAAMGLVVTFAYVALIGWVVFAHAGARVAVP